MFENVIIKGTHASRFIMSWIRSGGVLSKIGRGCTEFDEWLSSLGLSKDERDIILEIAMNGKMELEMSANVFLKNNKKQIG